MDKEKSQTDWERLERLKDEEIDTSDIPELTDSFYEQARLRKPEMPKDCL